ncbi:MAG: hypothetical protein OXP68_04795 [Anaerolineaceae bacterium]|nr:hypothetical protein [Anaerolineaceae bacterium]MDE0327748.1 hypothetical protein [Anaerolineaceae bacterium]
MIPRLTLLLLLAAPTLAACSDLAPAPSATALPTVAVLEAPPDTVELLTQAFHNIRSSATLRLEVQHSGEPWVIATDVGNVAFEEAEVSFVAPDTLQVVAGVKIFGLSAGVDLFARGEQQWYRNALLTGGQWQGGVLVPDFNPQQLVASGSGLDRAGQALLGLTWQGLVALEDGRAAHLLRGPARGEEVSALLVNLVQLTGEVQTEVYIDYETLLPLRFVLSQPDVATWEVRVTAVNAAVQLDEPLQAGV